MNSSIVKNIFLYAILFLSNRVDGQIIYNVGGNGISSSSSSDSVLATTVSVSLPHAGSFDTAGNYYFLSAQSKIRKISPAGIITTVVGTGSGGFYGDGGPATAATISSLGMHVDSAGNIYVADYYNNRVRKVNAATGIITTIAGDGTVGSSGDGGLASMAIISPWDIITDDTGNIYVTDNSAGTIRKISAATGIISTFSPINGWMAFDKDYHYLYFGGGHRIRRISMSTGIMDTVAGTGVAAYNADGIPALSANFRVTDITIDQQGNIFIADDGNDRVRKIDASGIIHTVAGTGIEGYNGDSIVATTAKVWNPQGVAVDKCGNLYIADDGNHRIRKVDFNPTCAPIVGVQAVQQAVGEVSVSPNPAYDEVTITAGNTLHSITITNMAGQVVYTTTPTSKTTTLNIAHLPAGIYILRADGVVKRVVKAE